MKTRLYALLASFLVLALVMAMGHAATGPVESEIRTRVGGKMGFSVTSMEKDPDGVYSGTGREEDGDSWAFRVTPVCGSSTAMEFQAWNSSTTYWGSFHRGPAAFVPVYMVIDILKPLVNGKVAATGRCATR